MHTDNELIIKEIVGAIRQLVRAVYLDSSKMSRGFGLTGPQSGILHNIAIYGPLSSADLSRKLYVTPSNITGIIDRLEKKGLVKRIRKEADRRIVLITLTQKGKNLSRSLPDPIEKMLISGLVDLEPEQVRKLSKAMKQILNLIDARKIEDSPLRFNHPTNPTVNRDDHY